jgi:hypothetical protein
MISPVIRRCDCGAFVFSRTLLYRPNRTRSCWTGSVRTGPLLVTRDFGLTYRAVLLGNLVKGEAASVVQEEGDGRLANVLKFRLAALSAMARQCFACLLPRFEDCQVTSVVRVNGSSRGRSGCSRALLYLNRPGARHRESTRRRPPHRKSGGRSCGAGIHPLGARRVPGSAFA